MDDRYKRQDPIGELYYESLRYIKNLGPTPEYSTGLSGDQLDRFPIINTWVDPVADACQANYIIAVGDQFAWSDYNLPGTSINGNHPGEPSNADRDINVTALTNTVAALENYFPGTLAGRTRGRDSNNWYIAGLAYYARTNDLRDEANMEGEQTVKTFVVDTQEFQFSPPQEQDNPLWLAYIKLCSKERSI